MNDFLNELGIQGQVLFAGFAGGVVRAITKGYTSLRFVIASPISGALCAAYLTEPFVHYLNKVGIPLPPTETGTGAALATAFVVGTCGMWIMDIALINIMKKIGIHTKDRNNGE